MSQSSYAQISPLPLARFDKRVREVLRDIEEVVVFSLPMNIRFRGITNRQGLLLRGPHGWGECSPFLDYKSAESSQWLQSGIESATVAPPIALRNQIQVNLTVPVCSPEEAVRRIMSQPGTSTAKVKVADPGYLTDEDVLRVHVVAQTLFDLYGEKGRVRIDANTAWSEVEAKLALDRLQEAASPLGGLEYAEQPVASVEELARLRASTDIPIAADESIRRSKDPLAVRRLSAADVAVLKVAPLGGIRLALALGQEIGLPTAVSSALDSSMGLAAGVFLAAADPSLAYACGLNTATLFAADVVDEPLVAQSGAISVEAAQQVMQGPLTSVSRFVDDETVEIWTSRLRDMAEALFLRRNSDKSSEDARG